MTDFEQTLRTALHEAVDAEEASPGLLIRQVRRRHRRHTLLVACVAITIAALAVPAAIAAHNAVTRRAPPATHKTRPGPGPLPGKLSGLPLPGGTNLQVLELTGAWYSTRSQQTVPINGLPAPMAGMASYAFFQVGAGWAASSPSVGSDCQAVECAGPPQEFYYFADGALTATPVGAGYQIASASQRGALWLVSYPRPSDDPITTSATAQLVSTAGQPLGPRYRLPAGYLINSGVGAYLALTGADGSNMLWNPRTGQTMREFPRVIAVGPEQIVWTQGCRSCQLQILNVTTGDSLTTPIPGNDPAIVKASLSRDGTLLAVLPQRGPLGVLDTATGAVTLISGSAVSDPTTLTFGWLGESHRLVVSDQLNHVAAQIGYWQPGRSRLWVASGTPTDAAAFEASYLW
jgi:hypothetical protein